MSSKSLLPSWFQRRPARPPSPPSPPAKTTFTLPPSSNKTDTLITCTTSGYQPSYHIPSPLTTTLSALTISSTATSASTSTSAPPHYREVFRLQRLPFVGFQLTSPHLRAQVHLHSGTALKSSVFVQAGTVGGLRIGGDKPAIKVRRDGTVEDAATGRVLAKTFDYKTGDGETLGALELAEGVGREEKLRDLLVAVWVVRVWNLRLKMKVLVPPGGGFGKV